MYLAISLLTLVLISSSSTALAQSVHLGRGFGPSGVVKLQSNKNTRRNHGTYFQFPFTSHIRKCSNVCRVPREWARGNLCPVTSCWLSLDNSLKPLWASFIIFCAPIMCQHWLNHEDNVTREKGRQSQQAAASLRRVPSTTYSFMG